MRRLAVPFVVPLALLASIASTPARDDDGASSTPTVSFDLENQYAESIFNVTWDVPGAAELDDFEGDATGTIAADLRLDVFESKRITDAFTAPPGTAIHITFTARSLGEDFAFDVIELEVPADAGAAVLCQFEYDYDLANAAFTVRHGCS